MEDDICFSKMDENYKKIEEEGIKNTLKYFDRIHDKLFAFNNLLIAGYFALSKINTSVSVINVLLPIANMALLVYIEYNMMMKSRFEGNITKRINEIHNVYGRNIFKTNTYSLLAILSTFMLTLYFAYRFR